MKPQIARKTVDPIASLASHLSTHHIKIPSRVERPVVLPEQAKADEEDEEIRTALQYVRLRSRKS